MKKLEYLRLENLWNLKRPEESLHTLETELKNCLIEFPPYKCNEKIEEWNNCDIVNLIGISIFGQLINEDFKKEKLLLWIDINYVHFKSISILLSI